MNKMIIYSFWHPTPQEIVVAIIAGLSMGIMIGFVIDTSFGLDNFNIIKKIKKFLSILSKKTYLKGRAKGRGGSQRDN